MIADKKKPVAAIRDIPDDGAIAVHIDRDVLCVTITRNICDRDRAVTVELGVDGARGRFYLVSTRSDAADIFERFDQADRAVAAHAEITDVVEKDDARDRRCGNGFAKNGTDDSVVPA